MLEKLESMREELVCCTRKHMKDLKNVDTKELSEAMDMIKDLSEAIYYHTITEAMKGESHKSKKDYYWTDQGEYRGHWTGGSLNGTTSIDHDGSGRGHVGSHSNNSDHMMEMRDPKEGRSHMSRRMYLESKEMGKDKLSNIQDLEHYMRELSDYITEII